MVSAEQVRTFILTRLEHPMLEAGFNPAEVGDDFDLLTSGVTDSIGIVELLASIEEHVGVSLDFSEMDPENLTVLGRLAEHVEKQAATVAKPDADSKHT
jgi:acyl carrier protein